MGRADRATLLKERSRIKKCEQFSFDALKSLGALTESEIQDEAELIKIRGTEAFKAETSAFDEEIDTRPNLLSILMSSMRQSLTLRESPPLR